MSDFQQEFVIYNSTGIGKSKEVKSLWSNNFTLTLLDLFKKYRNKVGSMQLRNLKKLWEVIAAELNKMHSTEFSPANCENRWRVLERNYKKIVDNNNKTGRGRQCFEFQKEMDEIFGKKRNIHPELLLSSDSIHVIPTNVESVTESIESNADKLKTMPEELGGLQPGTTFPTESKFIEKNKTAATSVNSRRKQTQSRNCTLQLIRHDKNLHHKEMISIHKERLEIEKQKLEERQTRNQLIKERNEILKMYLNQTLQLPNDLFSM
ncbi:hypothetical protein RI129_003155 [Pyrocoelia pectoralis]|uniref:Myb/SANT-like DNA-binding domain-containing protein n=1 Tax=Pyrocoelia pectoralis TaxID=417401 RepID=A0AAN7ZUN0_9COLE